MGVNVALITAYNANGALLLGVRKDHGTWTMPGGHMEPGESPEQAALRELKEETGLTAQSLSFLTNYTTPTGVNLYCFSAFVSGTPHSGLDPDDEVSKWEWIDISNGIPAEIYNNLHGPKDAADGNILKQIFDLKKASDMPIDLMKAEIDTLLRNPNPAERTMALKLDPTPEHLLTAALDHNPVVWEAALSHPNFTPELALKLMGAPANSEGEYPSQQLSRVLDHHDLKAEHLDALYDGLDEHRPSDYSEFVNKVGARPDISSNLWSKLYDNADLTHANRIKLMDHSGANINTLNSAIKEGTKTDDLKAIDLAKRAIGNVNVPVGDVEDLIRSAVGSKSESLLNIAAYALSHREVSPDLITELMKQARTRPEHDHAKLRLAALNGPGAKAEHLDRGVNDPSAYVRNGVPFCPQATPYQMNVVIDRAMKDKDRDGIKQLLSHPAISNKHLDRLLVKNDDQDFSIANKLLGLGIDESALKAAIFMCGQQVDESVYRRYLIEEDGDCDKAALRTCGFEVNDVNLKALQSIKSMSGLNKTEEIAVPQPESVTSPHASGHEMAQGVERAFKDRFVFAVQLAGKHSKGSYIARDEKGHKSYLLKPGSGNLSPAAGVDEELATQSVREAAFYAVAKLWGLEKWFPHTELILIDNKEYACMELIPWDFETVGHMAKESSDIVNKAFHPLVNNGVIFFWAILDFITGSTDRHGNNALIDKKGDIKLIDNGSSFAGASFDPANDPNTFTPFYLRCFTSENFSQMTPEQKLKVMPRAGHLVDTELGVWLSGLDPNMMMAKLQEYEIDPTPEVARLLKLQTMAETLGASQAICRLWAVT